MAQAPAVTANNPRSPAPDAQNPRPSAEGFALAPKAVRIHRGCTIGADSEHRASFSIPPSVVGQPCDVRGTRRAVRNHRPEAAVPGYSPLAPGPSPTLVFPMPALHAVLALPFGSHPRQQLDVFVPNRLVARGMVALIHGGWWTQGRHHDLRPLALHLAELGFASATIGHRQLGDGARFGQDLVDDVKAGITKALEESAIAGGSDSTVVVLGSGSGSLTALTVASQFATDARIRVRGAIACGVTPTLEHWDGCQPTIAKALDQFAGNQRHLLSPLELPPSTLPPLLLLHGDSDADVPAKMAQRLHARAIEADETSTIAVLTGVGHRFIEHPLERGAKAALERIVPFLTEQAREPEREQLFTGMADR